MSHSSPHSALRVLEQADLLGGADLVSVSPGSVRKKAARRLHVGARPKLGFAAALALVVQYGRQQAKELGKTSLSRCPRCAHVGPTERDFGTRIIRGERRPQSWCRSCRKEHLPPLKAVAETSGRSVKAPGGEGAKAKVKVKVKAKPAPRARRPESADGWLFPPELFQRG